MLRKIALDKIYPNPNQPRKAFDEVKLQELADSITHNGLLQPIRVRPDRDGRYMIIAGERRYRAHLLAGLKHIAAHIDGTTKKQVIVHAIVENLQRTDLTTLEEANGYQAALQATKLSVEALAKQLGLKQPWRITERLSLLKLRPEHQDLLRKGVLSPSQGYEMSRLKPAHQDELLRLIRNGRCDSYHRLRATAEGFLQRERQPALIVMEAPTPREQAAQNKIERLIDRLCTLLTHSVKENEVIILKNVNPSRAALMADQVKLIQTELKRIEKTLRQAAVQVALPSKAVQ